MVSQAETLEERRAVYMDTCSALEEHMYLLEGAN